MHLFVSLMFLLWPPVFNDQVVMEKTPARGLPNCFEVCRGIYSGGQPDGENGFRELSELGIKTIISVDGAPPNLDLAKRFRLRYVHIPHGYDGIEIEHARRLAKALLELERPIYFHCHHGKHRSPAAASVACIGLGIMNSEQGLAFLNKAGTSTQYKGLFHAVSNATQFHQKTLEQLECDFPESAPMTPVVQAMVKIEKHHDALLQFAKNKWKPLSNHPDLDPAHEALLLSEHYTELLRQIDQKNEPDYRKQMLMAEHRAKQLRSVLSPWKSSAHTFSAESRKKANALTKALKQDCRTCHQAFRD